MSSSLSPSLLIGRLRDIWRRVPLSRNETLAVLGICGIAALPLARQIWAAQGWPWPALPAVWLGLAAGLLVPALLVRLGLRHALAALTARNSVFRYWLLLRALVTRDLRARYARSALGWPWIIIQPLFQMFMYTALRAILGITSTGGMNFVVFLYTAILPWNFISTAVNTSAPAIFANSGLIKKMPVPREIFVLSAVATAFVDFAMGLAVVAVMMTILAVPLTWHVLWLPVLILIAALFGLALGLLMAAIVPFRADANLLMPFLMQLWFYLTPVFYTLDSVPEQIRSVLRFNPTTGLILGFRNILGAGLPPDPLALLWSGAFALLLLGLAWPLFRRMAQYFADMM